MIFVEKGNNTGRVVQITIVPIVVLIFIINSIYFVLKTPGKTAVIESKSMILLVSCSKDRRNMLM